MAEDSKIVVGRYQDPTDVRATLQRLERDGYAREDITLYTNKSNLDQIEETEHIETVTDDERKADRSFWEKVKDMVSYDDPDREMGRDASEEEFIAPFREYIRDGYTVIAVKNYRGDTEETAEMQQQDLDEDPAVAPVAPVDTMEPTDEIDRQATSENEKIQLKEERVNVKKEEVQTGEVHVRKETIHDTEVIEVPVEREQIVVERRSVGDASANTVDSETEEDSESFTIPIKEEKIIVEKEPVVTEEVEIKKERKEEVEHLTEDVRREEIDVDTTGRVGRKNTQSTDRDMDEYDRRK
jgi:uncharacterized protein (TIGR02271 family)